MSTIARALTLLLLLSAAVAAQSPGGLTIVVIEGEDGVNIIQQKTAVRPIVEVRDRNNLPVPGAIVTFSIEGGTAASFGGASTVTVATNAAGQAAVTSLTPSAAGAFQIQVSAAFQGQVASATIAQTNVMTAAQAAAASAAGGSGGAGSGSAGGSAGAAGGAGGGLSATTVAVVGAGIAGGALAATKAASGDEGANEGPGNAFTGPFSGSLVSTIVSRVSGNTCTITRVITGTAKVALDVNTTSAVSGRLEVTGSDTIASATCVTPANPPTQFDRTAALSGTPAAIRGSDTRNDSRTQAGGETINATLTFAFDGSLIGNTITGTMRYEEVSVATGGGGGPVDQKASGTFPVTLTRS